MPKNLPNLFPGSKGPIINAVPPGFITRIASSIPFCGSYQYSILPADTYRSNVLFAKGIFSASPKINAIL
ncbi:MAG: hypothetical protein IPH42_10850 [Bacteroidetes bacterium]|nr:hypothetical protein [Bacteroidota bacterium]